MPVTWPTVCLLGHSQKLFQKMNTEITISFNLTIFVIVSIREIMKYFNDYVNDYVS